MAWSFYSPSVSSRGQLIATRRLLLSIVNLLVAAVELNLFVMPRPEIPIDLHSAYKIVIKSRLGRIGIYFKPNSAHRP